MKIELAIPSKKLLERLDPVVLCPKVAEAELAVEKAEAAMGQARAELTELSHTLEELPAEIISGKVPQSALEETVAKERSQALILKSREGALEVARLDLENAKVEARALVIEEGCRLCELLKKAISPVIPLLEVVKEMDYEIEARVAGANYNPARAQEYARKPLPKIEWPLSLGDEQNVMAGRETLASISRK